MANILFICSATQNLYLGISQNGKLLSTFLHDKQEHSAQINNGIDSVLKNSQLKFSDLDAIAISTGPGSYTGLRVGYATAKALCIALGIPLIPLFTLTIQALAVANQNNSSYIFSNIDARRNEVFGTFFDSEFNQIENTQAIILDENFLISKYKDASISIVGNASQKCLTYFSNANILNFSSVDYLQTMATYALNQFQNNIFLDLIEATPLYGKEVYVTTPKKIF